METVAVGLGARSYDIRIGRGMLEQGWEGLPRGKRALVVTDSNVDPLYGARCDAALAALDWQVTRAVVPAGETTKSVTHLAALYEQAVAAGLDRGAYIVALGGGVVGDLAGFLAATFLRGIRLIQVPTSLLAMVDSSVGGKTGVNLPQGKNLVGAFYQPELVVADLACLDTLLPREYLSGLAEVVKYGIIWDAALFRRLESDRAALRERDDAVLASIVARSCAIKAEVVSVDEREAGVRAILNFGHTLGHAVEAVAGYERWLHGEAVAVGADYALNLSVQHKGMPVAEADRMRVLQADLGLPGLDHPDIRSLSWEALRAAMVTDKKSVAGSPRFVLAERLGAVSYGCELSDADLERAFTGE
ncbi:MAG: 3-dehydroquinate synthase [Verrucomicrobia bacterium]|jgi:3-dehydroquinate synthase|nr:3-dehydroquinate synthase [Verrucomicrobiota bacterium]MBT7066185.1 3-dehydroquinate synthase [Verrucomicrobiota bacterium]MBT7698776.1 3-dehydroquinate synthase [Verrucomicrobiota bacterium]